MQKTRSRNVEEKKTFKLSNNSKIRFAFEMPQKIKKKNEKRSIHVLFEIWGEFLSIKMQVKKQAEEKNGKITTETMNFHNHCQFL